MQNLPKVPPLSRTTEILPDELIGRYISIGNRNLIYECLVYVIKGKAINPVANTGMANLGLIKQHSFMPKSIYLTYLGLEYLKACICEEFLKQTEVINRDYEEHYPNETPLGEQMEFDTEIN